ncbi:site-specific DNA-methyltransferase [Acidobacteriota bacterium]
MKLKRAILYTIGRDTLKRVVDDLEITGVDMRSTTEMAAALSRAHRATPEVLLEYLGESDVKIVCEACGISSVGRKNVLIKTLLRQHRRKTRSGSARRKQTKSSSRRDGPSKQRSEKIMSADETDQQATEAITPLPEPPPGMMRVDKVELVWPGKFNENGTRKDIPRVNLPFQIIETINESRATREALASSKQLTLFDIYEGKEGDSFEQGWKNKLIWGDNMLVMGSLLRKFAGKFQLIYIDPPFATGADFSFYASIGDKAEPLHKEATLIEEKAYRDTWGQGPASYVAMMYDRLAIMRDLLREGGSIFVHCDWQMNSALRLIMDELFGPSNFRNEIAWKRSDAKGDATQGSRHFSRVHDTILLYTKGENYFWRTQFIPLSQKYIDGFYKHKDSDGRRYKLENMLGPGGTAKGNPVYEVMGVSRPWRYSKKRMAGLIDAGLVVQTRPGTVPMQKKYLDESKGVQVGTWWDDISMIRGWSAEKTGYATQKPKALLERIILASTEKGDLVGDFFCGAGTTSAVAEKLERRWINCDLGRFAIHTTRKRLLAIDGCKPFEILNLGKYERQYWQGVTFGAKGMSITEQSLYEYLAFVLKLYGAQPVAGLAQLHGKKGRAMIHIGSVDAPVTIDEINEALAECKQLKQPELHILGWEWEMGLYDLMPAQAKKEGLKLVLFQIPREVMEQQAVDKGDIQFFELAYLEVEIQKSKKLTVQVKLKDFVIPNTELIPDDIRSKVKKWSDYIDYWAVDWDFQNDTFMQGWVTYRTRKDRTLVLKSDSHAYEKPSRYRLVVKVIDIFGNDTSQAFDVEVR